MPKYLKPKPKSFHLKDSPNDWWSEFSIEVKNVEKKNHEIFTAARQAYTEMLKLAELVYGSNSKQYRYLKANAPESVPRFSKLKLNMQRKWELFLQQEADKEYKRDYRQRQKEAIERLENAAEWLANPARGSRKEES